MINAKGIVKTFGSFRALDGLDMTVPKGSIYGLIGPNGAGKTTIINHLMGVYRQDGGEVTINGENVWENTGLTKKVLCINDDWYFYPTYTVKEMAKFYSEIYPDFNKERYNKLGEILQIPESKQIRRLSKGMKKQVAFRMVLSCMPEILILDEPLDGLDPVMRKQIMNVIISDHVGIIYNGKMIIEKPLDDIKGNISKIQLAFAEEFPEKLYEELEILHYSKIGSVHTLIIKGGDEIDEIISKYKPSVYDKVSLTLEEVFIYELGGMGYDFKYIMV